MDFNTMRARYLSTRFLNRPADSLMDEFRQSGLSGDQIGKRLDEIEKSFDSQILGDPDYKEGIETLLISLTNELDTPIRETRTTFYYETGLEPQITVLYGEGKTGNEIVSWYLSEIPLPE